MPTSNTITEGYLISSYGEAPNLYINGTLQDAIVTFAAYNHNYSEVFDKACHAMETLKECVELYKEFYNGAIDCIIKINTDLILYNDTIETIDCRDNPYSNNNN